MQYNEKAALRGAASPNRQKQGKPNHLNFQAINQAVLYALPTLLKRWLPDGKRLGREWIALNPRRVDHHAGSFSVNVQTGVWADFATGDRGGDVISLAAYLAGISQIEAARNLAHMLEVSHA